MLSEVPREKYHFRPGNKWSVGQILTHLLTSERMALRYMKKKSLGIFEHIRHHSPQIKRLLKMNTSPHRNFLL